MTLKLSFHHHLTAYPALPSRTARDWSLTQQRGRKRRLNEPVIQRRMAERTQPHFTLPAIPTAASTAKQSKKGKTELRNASNKKTIDSTRRKTRLNIGVVFGGVALEVDLNQEMEFFWLDILKIQLDFLQSYQPQL